MFEMGPTFVSFRDLSMGTILNSAIQGICHAAFAASAIGTTSIRTTPQNKILGILNGLMIVKLSII
jgi:hypothetical protein